MPQVLRDRDWKRLIGNIRKGKSTPFFGAGASAGFLPLGGQLARAWAEACRRLSRNLAEGEWGTYVGADRAYQETCVDGAPRVLGR